MINEPDLTISFDTATATTPARPEHVAQPGVRVYAPPHDLPTGAQLEPEAMQVIERMRHLRRTARHFYEEVTPADRAQLITVKARLVRRLGQDPGDDVARILYHEVLRYLGHNA